MVFSFKLEVQRLERSERVSRRDLNEEVNEDGPIVDGCRGGVGCPPLRILVSVTGIFGISLSCLINVRGGSTLCVGGLGRVRAGVVGLLCRRFASYGLGNGRLSSHRRGVLDLLLVRFLG